MPALPPLLVKGKYFPWQCDVCCCLLCGCKADSTRLLSHPHPPPRVAPEIGPSLTGTLFPLAVRTPHPATPWLFTEHGLCLLTPQSRCTYHFHTGDTRTPEGERVREKEGERESEREREKERERKKERERERKREKERERERKRDGPRNERLKKRVIGVRTGDNFRTVIN